VQTLLALAHGILREQHDAEDVIHDVFLEAWRRCADYEESRGSVRTWLLVRTRYRAFDRLRTRVRRRDMAASVEGEVSPANSGEQGLAVSDRHRLPAALAQIPEALRHVILLAYFEGLSTLEISSRLGIPTGTVKSRTHAAIKTLRSVLGTTHE
jgi:RNA polymerase sigma-70 factor (ECF subfamily)